MKSTGILIVGLFVLSVLPVTAAKESGKGRKLVYVSTGASKLLFGECQWHRGCYPRRSLPLSYFLRRYEGQLHLSSWAKYWGPENQNQSMWNKGGRTYFLDETQHFLSLAMLDREEHLEAVYRLRPDGSEEELRPMFARPDKSLTQYSEIRFLRRQRSFTTEDISSYQVFSIPEIERDLGLSWGMTLTEIQKGISRDFVLQDPHLLFTSSEWSIPEWSTRFSKEQVRATSASWSDPEQLDVIYYAFKKTDDRLIRIFKVDRQEGLLEISEYSSDGRVRIIRREDNEIRTSDFAEITEYDLKNTALNQTWGMLPPSSWPLTEGYELVNPQEFFLTRGKIFVDWERKFLRSTYTFDPDLSWTDPEGYRYYIFWERGLFTSEADVSTAELKPRWFIQRYSKGSTGLDRIYYYNDSWGKATVRPHSKPHAIRIATTHWLSENWLKSIGVLMLSFVLYVAFWYRKTTHELDEDIRQMKEREKEKEEREKQEQEIKERKLERERQEQIKAQFAQQIHHVNYFLKTEHFSGAYQHLERLLREFPNERAAILQAKQRVMDAEQAALKQKHKDMSERVKLIKKIVPPPDEEESL